MKITNVEAFILESPYENRPPEGSDEALRCLDDPELALHEIVTHALPFAQWPEAFALARDGHDRALKVALTFPETA